MSLANKRSIIFRALVSVISGITLPVASLAAPQKLSVSVQGGANPYSDIPVMNNTSRTTKATYTLRLRASCYGTNLRSVANPVSPNGTVTMSGQYSVNGGAAVDFSVKFPGNTVANVGTDYNSTLVATPAGLTASSTGNLVEVRLPTSVTASVDTQSGTISKNYAEKNFQFFNITFSQEVNDPGGAYLGYTGPIGYGGYNVMDSNQSSDGKTYDMAASFPGENGFCGGYYSPLMVFFDKGRPTFNNIVNFKMSHEHKTYWPNKNHAGYFVGLLGKNGKIDSYKNLFGEATDIANGFENLALHDKNKDGLIDKNDAIYKKLVLWKDSSGVGKFNIKDVIYLSKKIKSIDLKYKHNYEVVGIGAEYRQRSTFTYLKNGKIKKGEIIDVWFSPYIETKRDIAGNN